MAQCECAGDVAGYTAGHWLMYTHASVTQDWIAGSVVAIPIIF